MINIAINNNLGRVTCLADGLLSGSLYNRTAIRSFKRALYLLCEMNVYICIYIYIYIYCVICINLNSSISIVIV